MGADLRATIALLERGDPYRDPLARVLYEMSRSAPALAAAVAVELLRSGRAEVLGEALVSFAYDARRSRAIPSLAISLERDRDFLLELGARLDRSTLVTRWATTLRDYGDRATRGEVPVDFVDAYRETLRALLSLPSGDRELLAQLEAEVGEAFAAAGLAF